MRPYASDALVCDLFAGTGSFSLALLEMGAKVATLVEKDPKTARRLNIHTEKWGEKRLVFCESVDVFAKRAALAKKRFHIIFADPPFRLWDQDFAAALFSSVEPLLEDDGIFLVRYPTQMIASLPKPALEEWKSTAFGEAQVKYLRKHG